MFFWNSLAFSMIQRMFAIWSLVPLPFLKPGWTSGSSRFNVHFIAPVWKQCPASRMRPTESYQSSQLFLLYGNTYIWPWNWSLVCLSMVSAAAAAASLQSCPTLCDPIDGSPPGFPSLGFSRQEHWSGLPFPSPMHEIEKSKWSCSVVSDSSDPMDCSLPGSSVHGIF